MGRQRQSAGGDEEESWVEFGRPRSPDLNPIEMAFSKLKAHLRRIGAKTFDALFEALGDICHMFTSDECWNFLKAAGYASDQTQNALTPELIASDGLYTSMYDAKRSGYATLPQQLW